MLDLSCSGLHLDGTASRKCNAIIQFNSCKFFFVLFSAKIKESFLDSK